MNMVHFRSGKILRLFHDQKVATMPQLKAALGTSVAVTVFRKLATLPCRSSYSHCGAYYTLDSIAQYDQLGLWSHGDIHFSRHGTLLHTAEVLVTESPAGFWVAELESVVQVAAKDALRQLVQAGRLHRRECEGRYLYYASDRTRRQEQWAARQAQQETGDDLQAAKALFFGLLESNNGDSSPAWKA